MPLPVAGWLRQRLGVRVLDAARWAAQCYAGRAAGAALALWPQGTTLADAPAVMSVTVNEKNRRSLALFAADEQQRF